MSFLIVLLSVIIVYVSSQLPPNIIDNVVHKAWSSNSSKCAMIINEYGGGIIIDSMYMATNQFSSNKHNFNTSKTLNYNSLISSALNYFMFNDTTSGTYMISHDEIIPWNSSLEFSVADAIGLFPIAYLDQLLYIYTTTNNSKVFDFKGAFGTQWKYIFTTADYYILQYPFRLNDEYHTVSERSHGAWQNETGNATFVWADDNFIGITLLSRLVQILDFCQKNIDNCNGINVSNNITTYIEYIYNQQIGYEYLIYPNSKYNGLYSYGFNYESSDHSCCPWGRANAWILLGRLETIRMYKYLDNILIYNEPLQKMIKLFQNHINEIGWLQDTNGKWHQVINDTSTFAELTSSAAFVYAIIFGRLNNILPTNVYDISEWDNKIELGWNGLLDMVDVNTGIIYNACCGTGIQANVEGYQNRSTDYCLSGDPGAPGFVMYATTLYQQYLNMKHN